MQIRAIDFARHTVVVSAGEAESGPSALPGSSQNRQGELVARVVALAGGEATLELQGQRVVVQSHVSLALGDRLFLKAEEGAEGQIKLSIQSRQAGPESSKLAAAMAADPELALTQLLDELGLPSDAKGQQLARALISRDGMLDPQAMRRLLLDFKGKAQLAPQEAGAAALLQKAQVAVTPQNLALMLQRPQPEGGAQLGAALHHLREALQSFLRQAPAAGPAKAQAQELMGVLKGLPLAAPAQSEKLADALRQWLGRLDPWPRSPLMENPKSGGTRPPSSASIPLAEQGDAASKASNHSPASGGAVGLPAAKAPSSVAGILVQAFAAEAEAPQAAGMTAQSLLGDEVAPEHEGLDGQQLLSRLLAKADGRPLPAGSEGAQAKVLLQAGAAELESKLPAKERVPELGKQLESLTKSLGDAAPAPLRQALREAIAELRYTQLVNQVPQGPAGGTPSPVVYALPLMAPQLNAEQPVAHLQVHHRPKRPGDPIDPNNLRLWINLPTEHLATVQIELAVKDGVIGVNLGLEHLEDRALLAQHLPELEAAVAQLGWPTKAFGTRARQSMAPVRQELSLSDELHHVNRVV